MKTRYRSKNKILIILLLPIGLVISWFFSRNWLRTKNIECITQYGYCDQQIIDDSNWLLSTPMLFPLPTTKLRENLKKYPQIKEVYIFRRLPSTLVIRLELRKPLGLVGPNVLGVNSLADTEGIIIGKQNQSSLPHLYNDNQLNFGDSLDKLKTISLSILSEVGQITNKKIIGKLEGTNLIIYLNENTQIIINPSDLPENWKHVLQLILDRSKIQSKAPIKIDLRFTNPVLTY